MKSFHRSQSPSLVPVAARTACAGLALWLLLLPSAAAAGNTPAVPVPEDRWGSPPNMRPVQILHDSTHYDGRESPSASTPIFFDADLAGDYLFSVTGKGLMVHDLSGDLENPKRAGYTYGFGAVPTWLQSDLKFYFYEVSAPDTDPDVAVTVGAGMGMLVWDFSQRSSPGVAYQDYDNGHAGPDGVGVWAAKLGGTNYAFTAHSGEGVGVWNLDKAAQNSGCDFSKPKSLGCKNLDVWMGKVPVTALTAVSVDGAGNFLAVGLKRDGLEIWNVANPATPKRVLKGNPGQVIAVQMWQAGSKYYLATLDAKAVDGEYRTSIWDVSCLGSGTCGSASPLSKPVASLPSNGSYLSKLTVSQSQGRTYLYAGHLDRFASGDQREFLWDVTDPAGMEESIAGAHELFPDNASGKGYPGWYYARNDTGFQNFAPLAAVVRDGYLFRAGWTILDSHEILGSSPPVADFDWSPQPVYGGQATTFTDRSSGAPDDWLWTFSGAAPSSPQSLAQKPVVTFNPGSFPATATVTLTASNDSGPSTPVQKQISVLDPKPVVGGVSKSPTSPLVCQQVAFAATGASGPSLQYAWVVKNSSGTAVATGGGNPFAWDTSSETPPSGPSGPYTAEVTVSNYACSADCPKASTTVNLALPPELAISSGPSTDPFDFGTVQFRAQTAGAASWKWDFGDGTVETFTSQSAGENPVHSYTEVGTYNVTLTVDNCIKAAVVSAPLPVTVTTIDPLKVTQFEAKSQCQIGGAGGCFQVAKAVEFLQAVSGTPGQFEYDWDGDGTWDQTTTSPDTSHTYTQAHSGIVPKLRITRGSEKVTVANGCSSEIPGCTGTPINVGAAQPATISISGATSGTTGQSLTFGASASNCTPAANGWTWTATGLNVSDTDGSITVSFSSAGSKTITAKNSACGTATGTRTVSITAPNGGGDDGNDGGGGGDSVTAAFSVTPAQPEAGVPATFDAGSSIGNITSYSWNFGDGSVGSGEKAVHTFSKPGDYTVDLSVSGPGECDSQVGGLKGICTDSVVKKITVRAGNTVTASFDDDADCGGGQVGGAICTVDTGEEIAFTDTSKGPVSQRSWDFGDGGTATGKSPTHAWGQPGTYTVTLTVQNASASDTATKNYRVVGPAAPTTQSVVVPWIAQADADKALHQTSDVDVHNPGAEPITVRMTFRKRGLPEPDPPQVERTVPAGATLHVPDAMKDLFNRPNLSGFLFVEPVEGDAQPVVTTFNRTFAENGQSYGQVVPGFPLGNLRESAEGAERHHLVGLNDNGARHAYFGISNPNDRPLWYHLRFYDSLGTLVASTAEPQAVARFGQRQYQVEDIRAQFGVQNVEDYRIEIEVTEGSPVPFIYGANLRLVSKDPSFLRVGRTDLEEVFLVGVLNTPGLNDSFFQSDVLLGNTGASDTRCDLTFTSAGFRAEPTPVFSETVPAGESVRLQNVASEWNVGHTVGVVRVACEGAGGIFPVVQGEGYDVSRPLEIYGQFMPALSVDLAAEPGKPHSLVGLRQDEDDRTTVWLYNPTDEVARYDVRYFALDGTELGGETNLPLGRGKLRQISPSQHPAGIDGGFVVRVEVSKGKLLTAAQVVNASNDPAYVVGQ